MTSVTQTYEGDVLVEDRTGGYAEPGSGFQKLRKDLESQRTLSGTVGFIHARGQIFPTSLTADQVAQAVVKTLETFLLPNDVHRIALYDSIARKLIHRVWVQQGCAGSGIEDAIHYEEREPEESVVAATNLFRLMPKSVSESPTAYMDETEYT